MNTMKVSPFVWAVAAIFASAAILSAHAARTDPLLPIYVDPVGGSDENDGKSWDTAVATIAHANDLTQTWAYYNERRCQIVLKRGTYVINDRIELWPRASIMGDPACDRRETILMAEDGTVRTKAIISFGSMNSDYVNTVANLTISNVVMSSGFAPVYFGCGNDVHDWYPHVLSNCVVTCCTSSQSSLGAAGAYMDSRSLVTHCEFSCLTNTKTSGPSAIAMRFPAARVYKSNFLDCSTKGRGAVYSNPGDSADGQTVELCEFARNYADSGGGAVADVPNVIGCTFVDNSGRTGGGAYAGDGRSDFGAGSPRLEKCIFVGNYTTKSDAKGGAVLMKSGCGVVSDCTFERNSAPSEGGALKFAALVEDCSFSGNTSYSGGALAGATTVYGSFFAANSATNGGAAYAPRVVSNCVFAANVAHKNGGGLFLGTSGTKVTDALVVDTVFTNNVAAGGGNYVGGGGLHIWSDTSDTSRMLTLRNCLFSGNEVSAANGCGSAAVLMGRADSASILVESCTFAGNKAAGGSAGAVYVWPIDNDATYFTNVVICANVDSDGAYASPLSSVYSVQQKMLDNLGYSLVHPALTGSLSDVQHVINTDTAPGFRAGTYVPKASSPLVNAGLTAPWMYGAHDLSRDSGGCPTTPRVVGSSVDIGAFEYAPVSGLTFFFY